MNVVADRLNEERQKWRQDPPNGFSASLQKNPDGTLSLFRWDCEMPGPRNTIWEQQNFKFTIIFNQLDLNIPPNIRFTTPVFHPNVCHQGYICSDLLTLWPSISVKQLIFTLQSFLENPNPDSPLNKLASELYITDRVKYNMQVVEKFKSL